MKLKTPVWLLMLVSLVLGVAIDRMVIRIHWEFTQMGRDLNELTRTVNLYRSQESVIKVLGPPDEIVTSVEDMVSYRVSPPKNERVLMYEEYPWGILVYVDKAQRVSRLILVRAP